jgi:hypothetical protein
MTMLTLTGPQWAIVATWPPDTLLDRFAGELIVFHPDHGALMVREDGSTEVLDVGRAN